METTEASNKLKPIAEPVGTRKRRGRHDAPTIKQIKAVQFMSQGMSKRQALLAAGYSKSSANQITKDEFLHMRGIQALLESTKAALVDEGITPKYLAGKFKHWLEATRIDHSITEPDVSVPDYDIQLKAYDRMEKLFAKEDVKNVKRKVTFEEFVTDGEVK